MRFQVTYGSGTTHQVELPGSVAVLGRDPGCDVVLNDTKCSRRHAVVEDGPEGLVVRDSGSANGVYLNGHRVERSPLKPGDTIRLGDVRLTMLAEIGETVVVALDDAELGRANPEPPPESRIPARRLEPGPQPPPARQTPTDDDPSTLPPRPLTNPAPIRRPSRPVGRPVTVAVLSTLWAAFVPISVSALFVVAARLGAGPAVWAVAALAGLVLGGIGITMSRGLWILAPWARHLQVVVAYVGLLVCPLTLVSATVLLYMGRSDVRRSFEPVAPAQARDGAGPAEPTFAASILGMLLVGLVLGAAAALVLWPRR